MDPTEDILKTWRALVNPETSDEACQAALLQVAGTQSFTFEPDASATPADVQGVEPGGSMLLDAASPAAKAMSKTVHVGVGVVSSEDCCLGIFNAKDARARMDPLVRVCSLPRSGRGACTNTSHLHHKIEFKGKRLLIFTPTASTATVPSYFSLPYLTVESLPPVVKLVDKILALRAPVGVWRSFFDGTQKAVAKIFPSFSSIVSPASLRVDTSSAVREPSQTDSMSKDVSPSSYDFLDDAQPLGTIGEEEKEEKMHLSSDSRSSKVEPTDLLDTKETALEAATEGLSLGLGSFEQELQYNAQSQKNDDQVSLASSDSSDDSILDLNRPISSSGAWKSDPSPARSSFRDTAPRSDNVPMTSSASVGSRGGDLSQASQADPVSVLLLQQIMSAQQGMDARIRSLEAENEALRSKLRKAKTLSQRAMNVGTSFGASQAASFKKLVEDFDLFKHRFDDKTAGLDVEGLNRLKRELHGMSGWRETVSERIGSLEVDLRNEDGLLLSQIRECKSAVAAGDLGAFTIAGHTFQNEETVLAFIQNLPGKNNYVTFPSMKDFFSLCGDPVSSLSENMVLHKATKGADFEDTFTARVNTSHAMSLPSVFARKSTSGDAFKTIWTPAFKSYSSFSGGMKNGGRTSVERQLRKVQELYRGQIRRRLPPQQYPQQNAVATAMADKAFLAAFDLLDATSKFYFTMLAAGLPDNTAWQNTQEMLLRVHEEFEVASCEAAEEDVDAGFIWSSMMVANKVEEFQRFRWGEHPSICSMLMFSILERLGDYQVPSEDTLAAEAMEKCKQNDSVLQDLLEKVKKDHETAANAVNQVKQLKEALAKEKRESGAK